MSWPGNLDALARGVVLHAVVHAADAVAFEPAHRRAALRDGSSGRRARRPGRSRPGRATTGFSRIVRASLAPSISSWSHAATYQQFLRKIVVVVRRHRRCSCDSRPAQAPRMPRAGYLSARHHCPCTPSSIVNREPPCRSHPCARPPRSSVSCSWHRCRPASPPRPSRPRTDVGAEPVRSLLWVGNSFFYYNNSMHGHVQRAGARRPSPTRRYRGVSVTISGSGLDWHDMDALPAARRHRQVLVRRPATRSCSTSPASSSTP